MARIKFCIPGKKHQLNVDNIISILRTLSTGQRRWLDLCCGQAWHFSMIKEGVDNGLNDRIEKVGGDLSPAQLKRAALGNPTANFILADVLDVFLPQDEFGLVTSFWAAYCYLKNRAKIEIISATSRFAESLGLGAAHTSTHSKPLDSGL